MRSRFLLSIVLVAVAALSLGTAAAWFTDSATIAYTITAADDFGGEPEEPQFVWVCKLVGPPDHPRVAPGENPIRVSVEALDPDGSFPDAQMSYVVESGEVECQAPPPEGAETVFLPGEKEDSLAEPELLESATTGEVEVATTQEIEAAKTEEVAATEEVAGATTEGGDVVIVEDGQPPADEPTGSSEPVPAPPYPPTGTTVAP